MTAFSTVFHWFRRPAAAIRVPVRAAEHCIFCDPRMALRSTGEEPLAFLGHLDTHSRCALEYQMWKQVITDEWEGD